MSRTPDKPDITAIKVSRFQKSEKTISQNRTLQTDRKVQEKPQAKVKSALMLLFLLNKKYKSRIEYSLLKINLCRNTWGYKKILTQYVSSILKNKIKSNESYVLQKLREQAKRVKNKKNVCASLGSWFRMKARSQKMLGFISIVAKWNKNKVPSPQEKQQPKYEVPSRAPNISSTRKYENRSLDAGKSTSASKLNLSKKIEFENEQDPSADIAKIKKQNQQLKLMELSEEAREVLKKIQRFDRFIYAQQAEKICKQPLSLELRRLQKIKNSQKEMRVQFYDNELTITALFNHIKLVSEMNRDINELAKMKQKYDLQQAKRKEEQFKLALQKKRNKGRTPNTEVLVKQLTESVQASLEKKQYDKAKQDITILINKHQKEQSVKDRIIFYQALLDSITRQKDAENSLDETFKFISALGSIDFNQNENLIKALKQTQRQLTILINKSLKNEAQNERILNIYRSFQKINTNILQNAELKQVGEKDKSNLAKLKQTEKTLEEANKKIAQIQAQLQSSKINLRQFEEVQKAQESIITLNLEFQNRIKVILEKVQNHADYKSDIEGLIKDKKFMNEKPYSLLFSLDSVYKKITEQEVNSEIKLIINFITLSQTSFTSKEKPVSSLTENFIQKYPKLLDLTKSVEELVKQVAKSNQSEQNIVQKESEKKIEKQGPLDQTKSRSLNEKIKSLQKINREQALKISSMEKDKKQFQSGKKPPMQSKSQQIPKNQTALNQNLQSQLKLSKDKILALEKQIYTLKNAEKKQLSQKKQSKQTKVDQIKKLQEQIKKLQEQGKKSQEQVKAKRQKETQQKIQRNKEVAVQSQLIKTVTTVTTVLEAKNYKQLEIQSNKILKTFQKDERVLSIATLISNLIKLLIEKQNAQLAKKRQLDSMVESQGKDKEKFEALTKLAKQSEGEIKTGVYLSTPDYWDKFLVGLDVRSAGVVKDLIKILKILTIEIKNKGQKFEQLASRAKSQSSSVNSTLQILKGIETEIVKKDYFKNDQGILTLENTAQSEDRIIKAVFRLIKKFAETSRSKLSDERKLNQKSIKSYEGQLEKMNNFISQYEMKLKQKDHQYQQLYKSFVELQKSSVGDEQKKPSSLRGSRRSMRSNSSDKDNELKNIKASMHVFAEEQKNMLERLEMAEHEKVALVERINYLQGQLGVNQQNNEELRVTIRGLQKSMADEHSNYQRQYGLWKQKTLSQTEQIERIRINYEKQFERRESNIVEQFQYISRQRQQALQKYHKDLSDVQTELNNQINHLREQLRLKNVESLKLQGLEVLRRDNETLQADQQLLRHKLNQLEQVNVKHQQLIKEHGQLQNQLATANSKHRQYDSQINSLKIEIERTKSLQTRVNSSDQVNNIQYQNALKENGQLQTQIKNLQGRNHELDVQIKKLQVNLQRLTQELRGKSTLHEQADAQLQKTVKQSEQLQLQINNLNSKVKLLEQQSNGWKQQIASLQRQVESKSRASMTSSSTEHLSKISQLEQQLVNFKLNQQQIIHNQVVNALKNQEEDFNRFLADHEKQIEAHFFNIIIPEKLRQSQGQVNQQFNDQNAKLEIQRTLQEKLASSDRILLETHQKIRVAEENERVLNQEIRKLKNVNFQLDQKFKSNIQIEENIKKYLSSLRISWQEAITGSLSENTTALYLRPATKIETKQVIREVIKSDPRQQATIKQLQTKLDGHIKLLREVEQKLNQERNQARNIENSLREQVRRVQSSWEVKYNQQTLYNQKKIYELSNQRTLDTSRTRSIQQFRTIELKLEQLNRRYIEETKIRTDLENKYHLSISTYQANLQKVANQKIIEVGQLNNELNICRDKNKDLTARLTLRENQLKLIEENHGREFREYEASVSKKYEQKIAYYQRLIAERNNQISGIKINYQNSLSNFNHQDCQRKYKQMQERLSRDNLDLRTRLSQASKSGRQEIELLKEVINNQKLEFRNFESMLHEFREAKEEAHRQRDSYLNELKAISSEKEREIFKLRADYQNKLTALSIEKSAIENRMTQSLQSIQISKTVDHSSSLKVLELQSQLNNKIQQIKQINDISQRRRRELEQLHQKLIFADRQIDNLRVNAGNMENHIMKLETDLSYFNNQVHKYKMALIQTESRQSVLRNDLLRVKTESDNDNSTHLRQEISALKDEIIRITSTNIHQLHNISTNQNFDVGRIRKMIYDIESQRSGQKYGYNQDQMQILKRINEQVTELVAANRQLQTKCIILESQIDSNSKFRENIDIFVLLQDRMENLMNFLLEKSIVDNGQNYSKFMYTSKEILSVQDIEGYFNNWLNFMKSTFLLANDLKSEELRVKAEEMIELKEQMNQILDKHIEFVEDESYETLDKYKMIFSDIKILMREYISTRNEEYLQMIWRSLEPNE